MTTLALLAGGTEWLVRTKVEPQDNWAPHLRLVQQTHATDLAFGDSHVARGFAAPDPWVNLAYPSRTVEQMAMTVDLLLATRAPARVILQADPHLFAPYRLIRDADDYEAALAADPAAHMFPLFADDRHRPLLVAYWSTFLAEGGDLTSQIEQTPSGALLSPGNLAAMPSRAVRFEALARASIHHPISDFADRPTADAYRAMVAALETAGAQICMVSFPVSEAYLAAMAETRPAGRPDSYEEALSWFTAVAAEHGATYVDHRNAVTDPALFRDVDHLNRAGALAYADRLLAACFDNVPAGNGPMADAGRR